MSKKVITAIAGPSLTAGLLGLAGVPAGAQAGTASEAATAAMAAPKPPRPPKGAIVGGECPSQVSRETGAAAKIGLRRCAAVLTVGLVAVPSSAVLGTAQTASAQVGCAYTIAGSADWDGDGNKDIIARQNTTGDLWLYPGERKPGPSSKPRVRIGTGWNGYTFAGVSTWDGDEVLDIVARQNATGDLWLYPGTGKPGPAFQPRVKIGNGWNGYTFAGITNWRRYEPRDRDIIARDDTTGDLWLYPGERKRGPSSKPRVRIGTGWNGYRILASGWFPGPDPGWDGDSSADLLAVDDSTGILWLYPGDSGSGPSHHPRVQIGHGWNNYTLVATRWWADNSHNPDATDLLAIENSTGILWDYPGNGDRSPLSRPRIQIGHGWC
ncbi:FG-GAP repeat domain-containing protein [Nonomuraea sp. M3C6]|uniref:FG-GAP repeat domain-containing protein n=1 Tax=Nonomuraea marmarensis TaxID=3351344 RepID=A0ABW7AQK4_9ACTN